jgi:hypothetical protein
MVERSSPCFSSLAPLYFLNESKNMSVICANEHKSRSWPFKKCLVEEPLNLCGKLSGGLGHFQTYRFRNELHDKYVEYIK